MKRVWNRLMTCRINKGLWKKIIANKRMGVLDQDNYKLIVRGANLVLLTFLVRLFSRIWITGNTFFLDHSFGEWVLFLKENIGLVILCFVLILFSNYLLGFSLQNPKVKQSTSKYLKLFFLILVYSIEMIVSFIYFMNTLYDFYFFSLVSLLTLPVTLYAYFIIAISILDFCIYTTDNSDEKSVSKGETIDYF